MLKGFFEDFGVSNIKKIYLYSFFSSNIFIIPNWLFFFMMFMSQAQAGFLDGIGIFVLLLAEVPTGAFADIFGKRKSLIVGNLFILFSCLFIITVPSFYIIAIFNTILLSGMSFISGAKDALLFDSLVEKKLEEKYSVVVSRNNIIVIVASISSTIIGGAAYAIHPKLPWILWIIFIIITLLVLLQIKEPLVDTYKFTIKKYFQQIKAGFQGLFNINLKPYILLIIVLALTTESSQGFIRQSTGAYFGFDGETFGYVYGVALIVSIIFLLKFNKLINQIGEKGFLILLVTIFILSYLIAFLFNSSIVGFIVFVGISIASRISVPLNSLIVNKHISSANRATIISTLSLISMIAYVILTVFFNKVGEVDNIPTFFFGVVIILSLVLVIEMIRKIMYRQSIYNR